MQIYGKKISVQRKKGARNTRIVGFNGEYLLRQQVSINYQILAMLGGYDSKAPQVLYGQTIALAHGPPEVHDSRK